MASVLEDPVLRQQALPMSVETYHALGEIGLVDEATELLQGFVFPKMSKSPRHCIVCQRLLKLLRSQLPSGCSLRQELPVTLADSEPEPDIALVEGSDEDYASQHPSTAILIIEVACSTLPRDQAKAGIYAMAGIPEYWLVNAQDNQMTVYSQPTGTGYQVEQHLQQGDSWTSTLLVNLRIDLNEILR